MSLFPKLTVKVNNIAVFYNLIRDRKYEIKKENTVLKIYFINLLFFDLKQ